jgi:antitoxin (DNA-binding transcriptional repressor) of toxin-antitoxin stability system
MPRLIRTQRGPPVPTDTRTTLRQRGPQPLHGYVELRPQVSRTRPVTARPQLIGQRQRTAGRLTLPPHLRRAVLDDMGDGSDNQIVSEISATDASKRFADMLDAVEHRGETFTVVRRGKAIATIAPAQRTTVGELREFLRFNPPDPDWKDDLEDLRRFIGRASAVDPWSG